MKKLRIAKDSLDMNMGLSNLSALDVVNNFSEKRLKLIIKTLGEENDASKNKSWPRSNKWIQNCETVSVEHRSLLFHQNTM